MPSEEHRYQVFGANNDAFQYLYPWSINYRLYTKIIKIYQSWAQ
jgi:hypothetical protein